MSESNWDMSGSDREMTRMDMEEFFIEHVDRTCGWRIEEAKKDARDAYYSAKTDQEFKNIGEKWLEERGCPPMDN